MAGCWATVVSVVQEFFQNRFNQHQDLVALAIAVTVFSLMSLSFGGIGYGQYLATFQCNTAAACTIAGLLLTSCLLLSVVFLGITLLVSMTGESGTGYIILLVACLLVGFTATTNFAWARRLERFGASASHRSRQLSMAGALVLMTLLALQFGIAAFLLRLSSG
jgi:hypothetical protein